MQRKGSISVKVPIAYSASVLQKRAHRRNESGLRGITFVKVQETFASCWGTCDTLLSACGKVSHVALVRCNSSKIINF